LTMERRSRRADGLARSLSRAGGINKTGAKGEISPLASQTPCVNWRCGKLLRPKRPRALATELLSPADHSTSRHHQIDQSTKPPIAPARRAILLYTLQNAWVRPSSSSGPGRGPEGAPRRPPALLRLSAQSWILTVGSWVMRENKVPYWQREFQKHDGLRTWEKVRTVYTRGGLIGA